MHFHFFQYKLYVKNIQYGKFSQKYFVNIITKFLCCGISKYKSFFCFSHKIYILSRFMQKINMRFSQRKIFFCIKYR